MDTASIDTRFDFAQELIAEAAALALRFNRALGELTVEHKGPQDLVTDADRAVETLIRDRVRASFPEDGFVGEETGSRLADEGVWVVDPIDGTQDFLLGFPTWCVSIAFVVDNQLMFGLITNPLTGDVYAARGVTAVGYSPRSDPADLGMIMERLATAGGVIRSVGSGALMIVWVATGQCIGYVEMYINAWDCLAAICIVNEAGGRTNNFLAENGPAGSGRIIAGGPAVFEELAALLP